MNPRRAAPALRCLAVVLLLLASTGAAADDDALPAIKAAFVYNFIKLVYWPLSRLDGPTSPVNVCIVNGDPMEAALRLSLQTKAFDSHALQVLPVPPTADLIDCHLLYLGASLQPRYPALMARAVEKGVLVVDEGSAFSWPDGMIRLFLDEGRVRFELNPPALERAGLKLDPRLIRLAKIAAR